MRKNVRIEHYPDVFRYYPIVELPCYDDPTNGKFYRIKVKLPVFTIISLGVPIFA